MRSSNEPASASAGQALTSAPILRHQLHSIQGGALPTLETPDFCGNRLTGPNRAEPTRRLGERNCGDPLGG